VLLRRLVFLILQTLVRGLRFDTSPVYVFTWSTLRDLCGAVLVLLSSVPLVFVVVSHGEWDRRCHLRIIEDGMRGVGTRELEGGGNVLGLRIGSLFERRETLRRNERCGCLVD
jgi:hypothetical protein